MKWDTIKHSSCSHSHGQSSLWRNLLNIWLAFLHYIHLPRHLSNFPPLNQRSQLNSFAPLWVLLAVANCYLCYFCYFSLFTFGCWGAGSTENLCQVPWDALEQHTLPARHGWLDLTLLDLTRHEFSHEQRARRSAAAAAAWNLSRRLLLLLLNGAQVIMHI